MDGKKGSKIRSIGKGSAENRTEEIISYFDEIRRYLSAFGLPPADFEDVLDEVFITALANADKIRDPGKIKNWLLAIAKNAAKTYFIRRRDEMNRMVSLDEIGDVCYCESEEDFVVKEIISISEGFRDIDLYEAMNLLNPEERSILLLYYSHGYNYREISIIKGMSESNVRVTAFRARRRLKKILEDMGYERLAR